MFETPRCYITSFLNVASRINVRPPERLCVRPRPVRSGAEPPINGSVGGPIRPLRIADPPNSRVKFTTFCVLRCIAFGISGFSFTEDGRVGKYRAEVVSLTTCVPPKEALQCFRDSIITGLECTFVLIEQELHFRNKHARAGLKNTMLAPSTPDEAGWRPKAIVFDLLTALLDSWTLWDASTPSGTSAEGRRWRSRYLEITFGMGAYVPYEDLVRQAASDAGLPESAPEALLRDWESLQPWPGARDVMQQLQRRGYKLGVVTNCSKHLGHIAAQRVGASTEGVESTFDAVICAEESGFYKPVAHAYQAILDALGVEARDALFVAGSAGDVEGATNVGMKVVWHNKVGLEKKGEAVPLREARTLEETLRGFL